MYLIYNILSWLLTAMQFIVIARALFSWFDPTGRTAVGSFLITVSDPIIAPIRRVMPKTGMIDLSPIVALLVIGLLRELLARAFVGG